jgi:hypothetical protein
MGWEHAVPAAAQAQLPVPSHRPVSLHPGGVSGAQSSSGSESATTGAQYPLSPSPFFVSLQAKQGCVQASLQQTLSTQNPDWQPAPSLQRLPRCPATTQAPLSHHAPSTQSPFDAQVMPQPDPAHRYNPQSWGSAEHVPYPSQDLPSTLLCSPGPPSVHTAAPHGVPGAYSEHAPAPLHCPFSLHDEDGSAAQSPSGSDSFFTGPQMPSYPLPFSRLVQASQTPAHAVLQHTESTQSADWHWPGATQGDPLARSALQRPVEVSHHAVSMQDVSDAHAVAQTSTAHWNKPQSCVESTQMPNPLHDHFVVFAGN